MIEVRINDRVIGEGKPVFIIAEAGVNHNGDIKLAKKLIEVAKDSGADAVKFQTFKTENIISNFASKPVLDVRYSALGKNPYTEYQTPNTKLNEMLKRLELSIEDFKELKKYADEKEIIFLSTPFDEQSVDAIVELGIAAIKISSGEITNHPLLKYIASKRLPIILSTGMSKLGEIESAIEIIMSTGNNDIILLHCVSNYPASPEDANLKVINTLQHTFGLLVGYSDHTIGIEIPLSAVTLGAVLIEKHFTLDRNLPGPDHKASIDPSGLKNMIEGIRKVEKALGNGIKRLTLSEIEVSKIARKSIVAKITIPAGICITEDMLTTKRPGTGISPHDMDKVIGRIAKEKIEKDELILWEKI